MSKKRKCPLCHLEIDDKELIEEFRSDIRYWLNQKDRDEIGIDYILKDIDSKWEQRR